MLITAFINFRPKGCLKSLNAVTFLNLAKHRAGFGVLPIQSKRIKPLGYSPLIYNDFFLNHRLFLILIKKFSDLINTNPVKCVKNIDLQM